MVDGKCYTFQDQIQSLAVPGFVVVERDLSRQRPVGGRRVGAGPLCLQSKRAWIHWGYISINVAYLKAYFVISLNSSNQASVLPRLKHPCSIL